MTSDQPPPDREAKRRAHFAAAKKAVLGLAAADGHCSMADMHDLSESRFFIAHQQFSALLEECVDEGLVKVAAGTVLLTDQGRAFVGGTGDRE